MQKCSGGRKAELFVVWMSAVCSRRCAALLPAQNRREGGARNKAVNSFLLLLKYWKPQFFLALSDHFTLKEKYTKQAGFLFFFFFYFVFLNIYTKEAVFSYFLAILSLHIVVYPVVGRSDECTPNVTHSCNILQGKNVMWGWIISNYNDRSCWMLTFTTDLIVLNRRKLLPMTTLNSNIFKTLKSWVELFLFRKSIALVQKLYGLQPLDLELQWVF